MKKGKVSLTELMRQNKEELLKDREQMESIERRMEEKWLQTKEKESN
ncbi:FbpB family small basic protein [Virgibacillus halodenitrificans]|nr:FbpB family small basic protein [Virgibacillus halodenitrificans]